MVSVFKKGEAEASNGTKGRKTSPLMAAMGGMAAMAGRLEFQYVVQR